MHRQAKQVRPFRESLAAEIPQSRFLLLQSSHKPVSMIPSRLLKNTGSCHSERSEESKLLIAKQSEMLRFAQHDNFGTFSAAR